MKVFQARFDTIFITLLAESLEDAKDLLLEDSDSYYKDGNKLMHKWDRSSYDEVQIMEVENKRSIIHTESH